MNDDSTIEKSSLIGTYVVYGVEDGKIFHVHKVQAVMGAKPPPEEQLKERALELAEKMMDQDITGEKRSLKSLEVINISTEEMKPNVKYKIDLQTKKLVSEGTRITSRPKS